jgi:acetyl-CoA carboxylase biotin carboxyl carrier protein
MKSKIDYKEITKLINFLEERNLSHFELEVEGFKISISRSKPEVSPPDTASGEEFSKEAEPSINPQPAEPVSGEVQNNFHFITSPMVGTFYRAPDPSSPPFVDIGDAVKKNQTLCIIEAMKLMNEIESDVDGIVEEIYIQNGASIEYGKRLFAIKPLD